MISPDSCFSIFFLPDLLQSSGQLQAIFFDTSKLMWSLQICLYFPVTLVAIDYQAPQRALPPRPDIAQYLEGLFVHNPMYASGEMTTGWQGLPGYDDVPFNDIERVFQNRSLARLQPCVCKVSYNFCWWAYHLADVLPFDNQEHLRKFMSRQGRVESDDVYIVERIMLTHFLRGCEDDSPAIALEVMGTLGPAMLVRQMLCYLRTSYSLGYYPPDSTLCNFMNEIRRAMDHCMHESIFSNLRLLMDPLIWSSFEISPPHAHVEDRDQQFEWNFFREWEQSISLPTAPGLELPERYIRCSRIQPNCWPPESEFDFAHPNNCMTCCDPDAGPRGKSNCFDSSGEFSFSNCCNTLLTVPEVADGRDENQLAQFGYLQSIQFVGKVELHKGIMYTSFPSDRATLYLEFDALPDASTLTGIRTDEDARHALWADEIHRWSLRSIEEYQQLFAAADVYISRRSCAENERWHCSAPPQFAASKPDAPSLLFESGAFCITSSPWESGSCCAKLS